LPQNAYLVRIVMNSIKREKKMGTDEDQGESATSQKMVRISFDVPIGFLAEAKSLADEYGMSPATINRNMWMEGVHIYIQRNTDILTNRQLRKDAEGGKD